VLPETDSTFLVDRQISHEVTTDQGMLTIVLPGFELPVGMDRPTSDLLIRLAGGYPDIAPDMWWFDPAVRLASGQSIPATDAIETYLGRRWQRWSRHFQPGQWQPGRDGLESYLALIRRELAHWAQAA
jgi:hypothetical protein